MHGAFCVVRRQFGAAYVVLRSPIVNGPLSYLHDNDNNSLLAVLAIPQYCGEVPFVKLRGQERRALLSMLAVRSGVTQPSPGTLETASTSSAEHKWTKYRRKDQTAKTERKERKKRKTEGKSQQSFHG